MAAPRVGVGVFVLRANGTFLLGKRKGSLGAGTYALPGGHLEYGESFTECAAREVLEETGLAIEENALHYLTTVNTVFRKQGLHYVTVAMGCLVPDETEPKLMEPEKCEGWQWVSWTQLCEYAESDVQCAEDEKKMLFLPMVEFVMQHGFDPLTRLQEATGRT